MSLLDDLLKKARSTIQNAGNFVQQQSAPVIQNVQHAAAPVVNQAAQYFNPTSNNGNNFWSTPVAQGLGQAQHFVQNAPQIDLQQYANPIQNPIARSASKFAISIPESILNAPSDALRAGSQLGTDYRTGALRNPSTAIGDLAKAALPVATIATLGGGSVLKGIGENAFKEAATVGTKQALKQGAIEGGLYGGVFGALQGLAEGRGKTLNEQGANAIGKGTIGAIGGAALGAGVSGITNAVGNLRNKLVNVLIEKHGLSPQEADAAVTKYARDTLGRFTKDGSANTAKRFVQERTGKTAKDIVYSGDLNEAVGLPRRHDPQGGFINFEELLKSGSKQKPEPKSISDLSQNQSPNVPAENILSETSSKPPALPISSGIESGTAPILEKQVLDNQQKVASTEDYLKQLQQNQQDARAVDKGGLVQKGKNFLMDVKRKLVDSTAPIEDILSSEQKKGKFQVLPSKNISPQIDRAIRSNELAGQFLKDNGMVDVIKQVPDVNALDQYLIAKHAPEVAAQGFKTGRDVAADAKLVQELAPTYEPYAQKVTQYGQKLLDYATQTGLVSKETATMLKTKYPNYVPINRIFNELEKAQVPEGVGVKGPASLSGQSVVKSLKGSERAIQNPIESLLTKTTDAFAQGERNQAGQMLASYKDLPGNPFQLKEVPKGESALHTISYLENGVKKTYETTPEIAQAAKFLDKRQLGFVGNILATPVRLARVGITVINLPFIASNIAKDQISGLINSDHALATSIANPPVFLKAVWSAIGHGAEYDNWVRNAGGGTSFDISRSAPETSIAQLRSGKNLGTKALYTVTHPSELLRTVENIVNRGEETTRLQQFIGTRDALLKEGRTPQDANILAGKASRENTVNFGRSGDWGKALNSVLLYMNAGIQGSRTLVRNLQTRPTQTAAKIALTVFTPLAALTAWNMSDPKRLAAYNDIRDFEKENNFIYVPENPTQDANGKWNVIKVPFSQEIANLTVPVRKGIEALHGADGPGFGDFANAIIGSTTSLNVRDPQQSLGQFLPQGIKPELEAALNKDTFTGADIVPQYLNGKESKSLPPSQQVQDNTSGTARKIGGLLNVSPIQVEHFVKSSAGGVGNQILNASDQALAATGAIPKSQIGGQSIAQGLTSRFAQATGGQKLTDLFNNVDNANQKGLTFSSDQGVTQKGKTYTPVLIHHKDGTTSYTVKSAKDVPQDDANTRKAKISAAKQKVAETGKAIDINGFHISRDENGTVHTVSQEVQQKKDKASEKGIAEAQYQLETQRYTRAKDTKGWANLTSQYIDYLNQYKSKLDPKKDAKEVITTQNKIEDLQASLDKKKSSGSSKKAKAIAALFSKQSLEASKLFLQGVKNETPSNVSDLERLLKSRSPDNKGLKSIESILAKSEALAKKKSLKAILGGTTA